ncbi:Phage gp6-like head-tail connector protein [Phaeobacter sp. CECT 5382]|uniref:head-tail connector protein n=1 Tax=Phaeobacter sp. CECT 5382 TaxID=1712645 RepID=UPI0006DA8E6C|nr:head-tail connector protein [Phaeobacter sp. CECT 5382]CUH87445.1 Phage gp6-like head-tail connector protein [Phaeobacter sp. CECT 5382]
MMLSEVTPVPDAALPLEAFKAHLRLGTGFGESGLQDTVLIGFLRASLAAIEKRTGKALLQRDFLWSVTRLRRLDVIEMPLAPVTGIVSLKKVADQNGETALNTSDFWLEQDSQTPRLHSKCGSFTALATGTHLEVGFTGGMAADWDALPSDMAQAVLMLAAHYYEYREDTALHGGCMPFGVASLIERYRLLRISAGAQSAGALS